MDEWLAADISIIKMNSLDIEIAEAFLRRLDLNLRTPDALHIAISQRLRTPLATFDRRMAGSARLLGVETTEV